MIMNRNFKLFMVALLLVTAPAVTHAREWTLKNCIDYALANNIALQKTRLAKASANEDYLQSKAALLPSLSQYQPQCQLHALDGQRYQRRRFLQSQRRQGLLQRHLLGLEQLHPLERQQKS